MSDQENCIMVATYNLWLQVNTFPAGQAGLQMVELGTVLFSSADLSDEWSGFIPLDQSQLSIGSH